MFSKDKIQEKKYSIKEVAHLLGVAEVTIWREIGRNKLLCYRFGARVLVGEHHIEKYLLECESKQTGTTEMNNFMNFSLFGFSN